MSDEITVEFQHEISRGSTETIFEGFTGDISEGIS